MIVVVIFCLRISVEERKNKCKHKIRHKVCSANGVEKS